MKNKQIDQAAALVELMKRHPELSEGSALPKALALVAEYLKSKGFSLQEIEDLTDVEPISEAYVELKKKGVL